MCGRRNIRTSFCPRVRGDQHLPPSTKAKFSLVQTTEWKSWSDSKRWGLRLRQRHCSASRNHVEFAGNQDRKVALVSDAARDPTGSIASSKEVIGAGGPHIGPTR